MSVWWIYLLSLCPISDVQNTRVCRTGTRNRISTVTSFAQWSTICEYRCILHVPPLPYCRQHRSIPRIAHGRNTHGTLPLWYGHTAKSVAWYQLSCIVYELLAGMLEQSSTRCLCRFGTTAVPATLASLRSLRCVTPANPPGYVGVEISLNLQDYFAGVTPSL